MVEVLIAGAGPAGCVAATVLARAGVRVLLLDRARFPRDKLCGDSLNPGTVGDLDRLGLARAALGAGLAIDGMLLTGASGVRVEGRYGPGVQGRSLVRRDLDAALLADAVAAGAHVEESVTVRSALVAHGRRTAIVRGAAVRTPAGTHVRIPACVTIAADGRRSSLAFGLGLARHPARPRRWAAGAYYDGVAGLRSLGEMHVRDSRYVGVAPVPGGLANVCVVTPDVAALRCPADLLAHVVATDPLLRERFARARRVSGVTTLGPLAVDARAAGMSGLLLAGDAAGFIDPMTGDGLRFAVRGGELAALAALRILQDGRADGYEELDRWRRAAFAQKWRVNRALRALVASDAGVRAAAAGARVAPFVFRRLIRIAGDAA